MFKPTFPKSTIAMDHPCFGVEQKEFAQLKSSRDLPSAQLEMSISLVQIQVGPWRIRSADTGLPRNLSSH